VRSAPSGTRHFAVRPGGGGSPQGGVQNFAVRGGGPQGGGGQNFVARGGGQNFAVQGGGHWNGSQWRDRPHVRGPVVTYGFATPYYYDDASPYYYEDDGEGCYRIVPVQTAYGLEYRRVWVCE